MRLPARTLEEPLRCRFSASSPSARSLPIAYDIRVTCRHVGRGPPDQPVASSPDRTRALPSHGRSGHCRRRNGKPAIASIIDPARIARPVAAPVHRRSRRARWHGRRCWCRRSARSGPLPGRRGGPRPHGPFACRLAHARHEGTDRLIDRTHPRVRGPRSCRPRRPSDARRPPAIPVPWPRRAVRLRR